jgi:hypothetical protein
MKVIKVASTCTQPPVYPAKLPWALLFNFFNGFSDYYSPSIYGRLEGF